MSFQVQVAARAKRDVRKIIRWIAEHSPGQAALWHFDFLAAVDSLQNFPARCPVVRESAESKELRQLLFDKYRIIFSIEDETVVILHVRRQRQRPLSSDEL